MFPPPPDDPAANLRRAVNRLGRRMRAERPPDALPSGRLGVLAHLYRAGPSSPGAVAAALHVQPQSLTRTLAALARDGMVTRSRAAADGRSQVVALTERGFAAMARDVGHMDTWLRARIDAELNTTEREVLRLAATLLDRLATDPGTGADAVPSTDPGTNPGAGPDPGAGAPGAADGEGAG
ncbi:MarR family winged helix-turn-helix transcriptional regulator [Streptomyces sp. NPDC020983]|uniref:MarR family winged helix-turn-helix transcriptional regulator n=1 Tax=Streptomyces sp. NPDC020983 TaxID=3365106 RepID=UPI00379512CB